MFAVYLQCTIPYHFQAMQMDTVISAIMCPSAGSRPPTANTIKKGLLFWVGPPTNTQIIVRVRGKAFFFLHTGRARWFGAAVAA